MTAVRIALANLRIPSSPEESVSLATEAVAEAARLGAQVVCFPECYVPGYRWPGGVAPSPDAAFLDRACAAVAASAGRSGVAVVLGTERVTAKGIVISALVINADGSVAGWQDKEQIDPSEESTYVPGEGRRVFRVGPLTFGVVICHEGWRYPETVRSAARRRTRATSRPSTARVKAQAPRRPSYNRTGLCSAPSPTAWPDC